VPFVPLNSDHRRRKLSREPDESCLRNYQGSPSIVGVRRREMLPKPSLWDLMKNRTLDIVIACLMLALSLPLMAVVALAIKLDSPGPVLCRRARYIRGGRYGGRLIGIFEFRTTAKNSQEMTRVGRFLLWARIDTLPQLVNVIRGELTCVGHISDRPDLLQW
jgi:lipopolysaccharide/colanic/teichoic acid biosynthesis glycosyltransferase